MTTSMNLSAIHALTCWRIAFTSSLTIARSATTWPAARMRSINTAPDLSSAASRVSETVSTAIFSGTNRRLSSMPAIRVLFELARALLRGVRSFFRTRTHNKANYRSGYLDASGLQVLPIDEFFRNRQWRRQQSRLPHHDDDLRQPRHVDLAGIRQHFAFL